MERASNNLQPMSYCRGTLLPTHILYADDVFICCVGSKKNMRCLLRTLKNYSDTSGQLVNFDKSKLFTGAMTVTRRNMLSQLSGFTLGCIPFQYLGCPIFQGKPKCIYFQYMVDRIKTKFATWKGVLLSIMGRVQLVKSVIHGMLVYSFHIYRWPIRLLNMLDKMIKIFIWSGDIHTRKICTVAWKQVCLPWDSGGLDLKSTRSINSSLLLHLSWQLFTQDSPCSQLFQKRFTSFGIPRNRFFKSSIWPGVREFLPLVSENSTWIIGTGKDINLWLDNWMGSTLAALLAIPTKLFSSLDASLASIIRNGEWQIPSFILDHPMLAANIQAIMLSNAPLPDRRVWKFASDGLLTSKLAHSFLQIPHGTVDWAAAMWRSCIPPSHLFVFWRLMLSKLPTNENIQLRGCTLVSICVLCFQKAESSTHLFLSCEFAVALWRWLGAQLNCSFSLSSVASLLHCIPRQCSSQLRDVYVAVIIHTVHSIWLARNSIRFNSAKVSIHNTMIKISSLITLSGINSNGNCLSSDAKILENFLIKPSHRKVKDIITVIWKPPTINWVKANTDGSVVNSTSSCGGLFRDFRGSFLGAFASNLREVSVFEAEIMGLMMAMEIAAHKNWHRLWLESDSSSAVKMFKNHSLIPIRVRNRWHNCMQFGLFVICSHIYWEGNGCADTMAAFGHGLTVASWYHTLPASLAVDFARDRYGLPNFRFP